MILFEPQLMNKTMPVLQRLVLIFRFGNCWQDPTVHNRYAIPPRFLSLHVLYMCMFKPVVFPSSFSTDSKSLKFYLCTFGKTCHIQEHW